MKKPNFFIVGAPKSGTTAMYMYLKQHPQIFMPEIKEPHFFGSDLEWKYKPISEKKEYLNLFSKVKNKKAIGEASVLYLYSKKAPHEIKKFSPNAKIIIMLRNPIEAMYSLHSQLLSSLNENIKNFKEALGAEKDRKKGLRIPSTNDCPQKLYYRDIFKYSDQVKRYFKVFGRKNVFVIIYDDFKKDPYKIYKKTLKFLGVDQNFKPEFKVINPNKVLRSRVFAKIIRFVRIFLKKIIPKRLYPHIRKISKFIYRINIKYTPREPMDPKVKHQLQKEFMPEVKKLSKLLNRDLTFWVKD